MRNKEDYSYVEELIHWLTKINDTRLDWLWLKFLLTAGASAGWVQFSNAIPVLNTIKPVTDVLSYTIFGGRFVMQSIVVVQHTLPTVEETTTGITKVTCLNDFLWGTSNFLSVQWLHGNELRPAVGTPGWWGNVCMEVLLVYDVIFTAWLFKNERQNQGEYKKQMLLNNLIYTSSLACGFWLFRGLLTPIDNTIPPHVGAGLCAVSTTIFRLIEWTIVLSKLKKKQDVVTPNTFEYQQHRRTFQQTCIGSGVSIGLNLFLPLLIWVSPNANTMILLITLSLCTNTVIKGCIHREKASPFGRFSIFFSNQTPRVSPASSENAEYSLA